MLERRLLVDEFFMNFLKGDGHFTSINRIDNSFVFLPKSLKNLINEIFFINGFSKKSKFIGPILDKLHVLRDRLGTLDTILQLVLDLFDVTTGWFGICISQSGPGLLRSGSASKKRLDG